MLTPADARRILGAGGAILSDEEVARLLAELYALAGIVIDSTLREQRKQEN